MVLAWSYRWGNLGSSYLPRTIGLCRALLMLAGEQGSATEDIGVLPTSFLCTSGLSSSGLG